MGDVGKSVNGVTRAAIGLAEQTLSGDVKTDMLVAGQNNLMDSHELAELETLRHLFQAFVEKRELLSLLDQCLSSDGLQIFIGRETGYRVLDNCSVVTAPYSLNGDSVGVLGVIGPTRMSYEKIIPVVNVTAKFLGAALNR